MPNLAWWPVVALGVWRAGAAISPLSPLWTADESARVLARAAPRLAIAFAPLAGERARRARRAPACDDVDLAVLGGEAADATPIEALLALDAGDPYAEPDLGPDDLAAVPFSSGTGGLPKGVRLTHGNLAAAAEQGDQRLALRRRLRRALGGPRRRRRSSTRSASRSCSARRCASGRRSSPSPARHSSRCWSSSPRTASPTWRCRRRSSTRWRQTRASTSTTCRAFASSSRAARTCTRDVEQALSERLGCVARQGYGTTEATCTISAPSTRPSTPGDRRLAHARHRGAARRPRDRRRRRARRAGRAVGPRPAGHAGLPRRCPRTTAAALTPDGWLRTGDLVAIRDDGQLEIRDRLKELIKVKGASVAPAEIELVLRQHPAVHDAGVVGVPDAERGEAPVAFVALDAPAEPAELADFAAARLAGYKRPREIVVDRRGAARGDGQAAAPRAARARGRAGLAPQAPRQPSPPGVG